MKITQKFVIFIIVILFISLYNSTVIATNETIYNYNNTDKILELKNYINETIMNVKGVGTCQMYFEDDVSIVLSGENKFEKEADYGIYCEGKLTIIGEGELLINNIKNGIYVEKGIEIIDIDLTIIEGDSSIISNWGNITIDNSRVTVTNEIETKNKYDMNIVNSTVSVGNICSSNFLDIKQSVINAEYTGYKYYVYHNVDGIKATKLVVNDSEINGVGAHSAIDADDFETSGSIIICKGMIMSGSGAIDCDNLLIHDGEINATGGAGICARYCYIEGGDITAVGDYRDGFYSSFGWI